MVHFRAGNFHTHIASCTGKSAGIHRNTAGFSVKKRNNRVQDAPMDFNPPDPDGRVRCKLCERAFSQDRISKHQSVCHGKPRLKENRKPKQRSEMPAQLE
ncbi:uncharacterized protein PITG_15624 [Phytophthora infestans T30-4]|uniref:Uncharacterized protein n=1 Tax=Phytophthora infestans (strain T30-4) TaxID=403677 RepID=D0NT76_PHYIT|nr:uncharacterized protein PITG_15624 [Phytophthora infestans T30-4]EEY64832.1 hypothetical protein PITG_15624 [Phytophthora infestans T30-4]|eukprot:XP_002897759.1 hypothetical protein PITG_15624 [Phytophthora infestans T30-4]